MNCFIGLSNLNDLCLYKNKLKQIESDAFKYLVNLKTFELNNNQIEEIQEGSFNGLSNLKHLHLDHNKLKIIGAKIERLFLNHNELEEIHLLSQKLLSLSSIKSILLIVKHLIPFTIYKRWINIV